MDTALALCPFCEGHDCEHFVGWTDDGRTIDPSDRYTLIHTGARTILPTDRIVTTGVSARVYREGGLS